VNWITLRELLIIHERVIAETGGLVGLTNPAGLDSALTRPFTSFGGADLFPDLVTKISVLIHTIISFHPFVDGNKRVALAAADVCLRLNGFRLVPSTEIEPFFWSIARGEREVGAIAQWLKAHVEPWQES
jgi:death-on-curing protein